jgi:hypothetical protein
LARLSIPTHRSSVPDAISFAFRAVVSTAIALFILLAVYNTLAGTPQSSSSSRPGLPGAYYQLDDPPYGVKPAHA